MLYSCRRLLHTCAFPHNNHQNKLKNFKSITIREFVGRTGISHSTVSRALNHHPAIVRETDEWIQQLAREINDVPSLFARRLKTHRSHPLGGHCRSNCRPFYSEILGGIQNVAHQFQYGKFMSASENDMERQATLKRGMFGQQAATLSRKAWIWVVGIQDTESCSWWVFHKTIVP